MSDPFEWQDCGETAHAIPISATYPPLPGDKVHTLCGQSPTLTREDFSRANRWWIKNCTDCMAAWRGHQVGLPAR